MLYLTHLILRIIHPVEHDFGQSKVATVIQLLISRLWSAPIINMYRLIVESDYDYSDYERSAQVNGRGLVSKPNGLGDSPPILQCRSLWIDEIHSALGQFLDFLKQVLSIGRNGVNISTYINESLDTPLSIICANVVIQQRDELREFIKKLLLEFRLSVHEKFLLD